MAAFYRFVRGALAITGLAAVVAVGAALAGVHQHGARWLAQAEYAADCDYILLLPAGAVPSPVMLMRSYKAAEEYHKNPRAKVVISHKTTPPIRTSTIWTIRRELVFRGVPPEAILLELKATNTAEHARFIRELGIGDIETSKYLVVTSPTHMRRAVAAFRAAGFRKVYGAAARARATGENLGGAQALRYDIWYSVIQEIVVLRELVALAWYKLNGLA